MAIFGRSDFRLIGQRAGIDRSSAAEFASVRISWPPGKRFPRIVFPATRERDGSTSAQDDDFIGKLRLKFAELISSSHPEEAHAEVDRVCALRVLKGYQPSRKVQMLPESTWYRNSAAKPADRPFYLQFTEMAEALLFSHLPWVEASVGDSFEIPSVSTSGRARWRSRAAFPLPILIFAV